MPSPDAPAAIAGLAALGLQRRYEVPAWQLAVQALHAALADAGLAKQDVDGLLINKSPLADLASLPMDLQDYAGLKDLRLLSLVEAEGSSALQMLHAAVRAIRLGEARCVLCVFADAPLQPGVSAGRAFGVPLPLMGALGAEAPAGLLGPVAAYGLSAQRYLARFGYDTRVLAEVAVSNRAWAGLNPDACLREPLTVQQHHDSPWIVEPFRLLDCAYPVNGAVAFVVTTAGLATELKQPPVYVHGIGQGHCGITNRRGYENELDTGGRLAGEAAYAMAGIGPRDIELVEFYDAFSFCDLLMLEEYGFSERGQAPRQVAAGDTAPGGRLPMNTGGGHLSGWYLQGVTPLHEAVVQARGQAGERQCSRHDLVLATGYGGRMQFHACAVLSPQARLRGVA